MLLSCVLLHLIHLYFCFSFVILVGPTYFISVLIFSEVFYICAILFQFTSLIILVLLLVNDNNTEYNPYENN